jgi:hypothetical protein
LRWAISLGVFKTEEAARAQLVALNQKGVHSARLGSRGDTPAKLVYQLHNLDASAKTALDKIALEYLFAEMRNCASNAQADNKNSAPTLTTTSASASAPRVSPTANLPRDAYR